MKEQHTNRLRYWTPFVVSLTMVAGMFIGFKLRDSLRHKRNITTIVQRNDRLEQIIDLINERYVDSVNTNLLYRDAVNGIISHLDPHTVYIPADKLDAINEDLDGSFFGIGVEFSIVRDTIQITAVVENGPADVAGVVTGDKLVKVGDSLVAGNGITSERIIGLLKGKQFSKVFLSLLEPGSPTVKVVGLKRDAIPKHSVDVAIMLDSLTGIIKINRFSATTYEEFKTGLSKLKKQGLKNLVVDLRQNSGGYLDPARRIADEFLSGDKMIVFTQGANSIPRRYIAERQGDFEDGRLTILIDEQSASASEILAGAVQDWDRGIIMGRRTFGKGLVQDQYELEDGSALRLTIAKYYTPSGRSVQRSFDGGRDDYEEDFYHRFETGELTGYDTVAVEDTTRYFTSNNRVVYGGGGIRPDVYVPYDTTKLSTSLLNLIFSDGVKSVIWDYYIANRTRLRTYANIDDYKRNFKADTLIDMYLQKQDRHTRKVIKLILEDKRNRAYFKLQLKAQMARLLFRDSGYYSLIFTDDAMVRRALSAMYSDEYSKLIGR
ncbi:MAG: S41 family peptidase [Chitinophagales bacterium]|nr:S41 family peptidase [Chitinophagaceae bacterium]MCB9064572.1 S41 family peptidase [Chitinophagales bacterium]